MVQQEHLGSENEHGPPPESGRADAAISNIIVNGGEGATRRSRQESDGAFAMGGSDRRGNGGRRGRGGTLKQRDGRSQRDRRFAISQKREGKRGRITRGNKNRGSRFAFVRLSRGFDTPISQSTRFRNGVKMA